MISPITIKFSLKKKVLIGINPHERHKKQLVYISGHIFGIIKKPIKKTIKYHIKSYLKYSENRLIEKTIYDLAIKITTLHKNIDSINITIKKPKAIKEAKAVGVSLSLKI